MIRLRAPTVNALNNRDFVLVHILEPVKIGLRFTSWPLHITLLPWFSASDYDELQKQLKKLLISHQKFSVETGERAYFGYQGKLPVTLIEPNDKLQQLHEELLKLVEANNWNLEGRYVGSQYRPHVTQQVGKDAEDSPVVIDKVTIVEKLAQGYRQVVGDVGLGNG